METALNICDQLTSVWWLTRSHPRTMSLTSPPHQRHVAKYSIGRKNGAISGVGSKHLNSPNSLPSVNPPVVSPGLFSSDDERVIPAVAINNTQLSPGRHPSQLHISYSSRNLLPWQTAGPHSSFSIALFPLPAFILLHPISLCRTMHLVQRLSIKNIYISPIENHSHAEDYGKPQILNNV